MQLHPDEPSSIPRAASMLLQQGELLRQYYRHLNKHPEFVDALVALFDAITSGGFPEDLVNVEISAGYLESWRSLLQKSDSAEYAGTELARCQRMLQIRKMLKNFSRQWYLLAVPEVGEDDLLFSYGLRDSSGNRFQQGLRGQSFSRIGEPVEVGSFGNTGISVVDVQPWINLKLPIERILYDPLRHDASYLRKKLDDVCGDLRRQAQEQAREFDRQSEEAGLIKVPSWYTKPDYVRLLAQRIFSWNILRKEWHEIADSEEASHYVDPDTVRKTATRAARASGIPLRKKKRQLGP